MARIRTIRYDTISFSQKGRCDTIQFVFHKWQYDTMRYALNPKKSQTVRYDTIALTKTVIRYVSIRLKFANAPPDTMRYDSSMVRRYDTITTINLYLYDIFRRLIYGPGSSIDSHPCDDLRRLMLLRVRYDTIRSGLKNDQAIRYGAIGIATHYNAIGLN